MLSPNPLALEEPVSRSRFKKKYTKCYVGGLNVCMCVSVYF